MRDIAINVMLILNDIHLHLAGRPLIEGGVVRLDAGSKVGFVGHNGTGKTSLFRAISGELALLSGEIRLPKTARIGQVSQEAPGGEEPLIDIVLAHDHERRQLLLEAETATDPSHIAEIHTRLGDIDAHSAPARAGAILSGLGFSEMAQRKPASTLSGGWRMRLALAAVLFSAPDLLLLDEPTNYLDLDGILWLVDYLRRYPHSCLIISHDRDLLNQTVTAILHLENRKLTLWRGNYDQFARQYAEARLLQQKQAVKQQAARTHMEAFVARFRAKASKARQAQSRLKALEKMTPVTVWNQENVTPFRFPEAAKAVRSPIIALSDVAVGYEAGKPILRGLTLRLDHDDRIALLGANGNGKSTFAKLLAGRLKPQSGSITVAPGLKVAFFAQHQLDDLYPQENAIEHLRRLMPEEEEARLRARIAQMGLATAKMFTPAKDLSGGEKARLLMGLACHQGANLLILDEPTNHLDIDSRAELIDALNEWGGAVVLIAHDRHLIDATAERLWQVTGGTVSVFDGDMDDYRAHIIGHARRGGSHKKRGPSSMAVPVAGTTPAAALAHAKAGRHPRPDANRRAKLAALRKEIQALEKKMTRLQQEIAAIDVILSNGELYHKQPLEANKQARKRAEIVVHLEQAEQNWLELSENYDNNMC